MVNKISIKEIYFPIKSQLEIMEKTLESTVKSLNKTKINNVFLHSFKIRGKRLRPALLLLCANAVSENSSEEIKDKLNQMALALELIHTASLIHDDIIDNDILRRGQKTLNSTFGNKAAVLAGDVLHAHSFLMIVELFSSEYHFRTIEMIKKMCLAEIKQLSFLKTKPSKKDYLEIKKGKTALFMSNCCRFGATISGASDLEIASFESYGLNFGMAFQIIDDYLDKDSIMKKNVGLKEAKEYINRAKDSLCTIKESVYKQKLEDLLKYIINTVKDV